MHATPGGRDSNRVCCVVRSQCQDDGNIEEIGNCLVVRSASVRIIVAAQTTFRFPDVEATCLRDADKAILQTKLRENHIFDYNSLFGRFHLRLGPKVGEDLATDERLARNGSLDTPDPILITLYHNYARYLLISCSRPGPKALPATLQGLWNPSFQPAWGSKYTININTQMNYWPANICNLSECETPLFEHLERMADRGQHTAKLMYGCRGWAAHHNTDIWADTDPQDRYMPSTCKCLAYKRF
jgi:hypothetical protein